MRTVDVAVIGAGPAGSALAIRLARKGLNVLLSDREIPGRNRVCGGFLGPELSPILRELGMPDLLGRLDARPIREVIVSGPGTLLFSAALPGEGGHAIDRGEWDRTLFEEAQSAGAIGWAPADLAAHHHDGSYWQLTFRRGPMEEIVRSRVLVFATGRRHHRSPGGKKDVFYACKCVYEDVDALDGRVALHFLPKAHVGLNPLPDRRVTMCLYAAGSHLRRAKGDLDHMMEYFMKANGHLHESLRRARRVSDWSSCQAEPDGKRIFLDGQALRVGDAVSMVNPIVGGGIPIAMHSAILLADTLAEGFRSGEPIERTARRFETAWERIFLRRVRFAALLGQAERSEWLSRAFFLAIGAVKPLLPHMVRRTRPKKKELSGAAA